MSQEMSARQAALDALAEVQPEPTDLVEYVSRGQVCVFAPSGRKQEAEDAAAALSKPPRLLVDDNLPAKEVRGHLGAFEIVLPDGETVAADAIVDFFHPPVMRQLNPGLDVLPPGYVAAQEAKDGATLAMTEAEDLRGVFHKPRYYQYDASLCAHGASGKRGCQQCLNACPAQAIVSAGETVSVNSNLCQGCGLCSLVCPSGAMRYAYPPPADMLQGLRAAVSTYRRHSSQAPTVVFYAAESAQAGDISQDAMIIPAAVEEAGAAGIEIWLCALAYGAAAVAVFADNPRLAQLAREQAQIADAITDALGLRRAIHIVEDVADIRPVRESALAEPAGFAPDNDKRTMFFMALGHLVSASQNPPPEIALPPHAPFGEITVNDSTCTLCMACAGVCPASAVRAGGDSPRLLFVEENCLQCGLCQTACPENAIELHPRLLSNGDERKWLRTLNEDVPQLCLQCGKPFASSRAIRRIEEKLKEHWMFKSDKERRRLRLCEECRVRDMFDK